MSRLTTLSPAALRAMFSPNADDTFVTLLTITSPELATPIRVADNFITRLSETADDILYGLVSRGNNYIFLPLDISLPTEDHAAATRASVSIQDATKIVLPHLRQLITAPAVTLELVLKSTPDVVEVSFTGLKMRSISYNASSITGELGVEDNSLEPFPQHTITPAYFPAAF